MRGLKLYITCCYMLTAPLLIILPYPIMFYYLYTALSLVFAKVGRYLKSRLGEIKGAQNTIHQPTPNRNWLGVYIFPYFFHHLRSQFILRYLCMFPPLALWILWYTIIHMATSKASLKASDRQNTTEKELGMPGKKWKMHFLSILNLTIMAYLKTVGCRSSVRTLMHHLSQGLGLFHNVCGSHTWGQKQLWAEWSISEALSHCSRLSLQLSSPGYT